MRVAIVGAGGHGQVVADLLQQRHLTGLEISFFDDRWQQVPPPTIGKLVGPAAEVSDPQKYDGVFVAIGDNRIRRVLQSRLEALGHVLLTLAHPHTAISPQASLGPGTIAIAGVVANCGSRIGKGVILNTLSSVGHDCRVGDFAQLAPGVNLGGSSVVGDGVFLGIGAKVGPRVRIGDWSVVGAGSVVLDDLPDRHFCAGTPAKPIRPLSRHEVPE